MSDPTSPQTLLQDRERLEKDLLDAATSISNLMAEIRILMIERDEARKERDDLRRRYSNAIGPR